MYRRTILLVAFLLMLGGVAYARRIAWKPNEKPPVSLAEAAKLADVEAAKQEDAELFCISVSLAKTFSGGDWEFRYSSAKGKHFWVSVGSDKSVRTSDAGFEY